MFHKLRNRLVLINTVITTIVLVIAFATIYIVAQNSTAKRPIPRGGPDFSQHDMSIMEERVRDERRASLNSLLISLMTVGAAVEVAVFLASYCLAEIAIRPVREAYEAQKIFIANASHEIKTPLAAITANLEAASIEDNKWIDNVNNELQLLNRLNQEMLDLARADSAEIAGTQKQTVVVKDVFEEIANSFASKIRQSGIELEIIVKPEAERIVLAEGDFRQTITILLDNAIKYGDKEVILEYNKRTVCVANDGTSIPEKQLEHVFERFYQVDKSAEGSGLGLAIAKALAERNKWKLTLESNKTTTQARLLLR